jgi:hypothetical protein
MVRDVAAQTGPGDYHVNKEVAEACSFRNTQKCARVIARLWDRFASTALSALPLGFGRDGVFPEPNAPSLLALNGLAALNGLVRPDGRFAACPTLPVTGEELTRLVCNAREQLRPYGRTSWDRENRRLEELSRLFADAKCLPADVLALCSKRSVTTVASTTDGDSGLTLPGLALEIPPPAEASDPIDLVDERRPEPFVDLK